MPDIRAIEVRCMQFAQSVDARTALRAASVRFPGSCSRGREPRFTSALGGILEPDFASKRDRSIDARIGQEERIESAYKASDPVSVEREAPRHADESERLPALAHLFGE